MVDEYLSERAEYVREAQNADGGWGYAPGKQSRTEPTIYAMLALEGEPSVEDALERAWRLLRSWQHADGGWKPAANVEHANWTTALMVTLHCVRGVHDEAFLRGVEWLIDTRGVEGRWLSRILYRLRRNLVDSDPSFQGWPWLPGTCSWVEPTSHALVALRRASRPLREAGYRGHGELDKRVRLAEKMMLQRRAQDGGWNYGNRTVLGEALPSYPETTGVGLVGMKGCPGFDASLAVQLAHKQLQETRSPLARAWLTIGLRNHGYSPALSESDYGDATPYIHVAALETLAAHGSNYRFLAAEETR